MENELNKLFVITGPSGVGKTSVAYKVLEIDLPITKVISITTRKIRDGETADVDYHFISKVDFEQKIEAGDMFEWAKYSDNYYGSQTSDVEKIIANGKTPFWVVDVQGAKYFKEKFKATVVIFIAPESLNTLKQRLTSRGDDAKDIKKRLRLADKEMKLASVFDYQVINFDNQLVQTVDEIARIIEQELA